MTMPVFHRLTVDDREVLQRVTLHAGRRNCNYTFANLIGWRFWFNTEVAILPDTALFRFNLDGHRAYMVNTAGTPSRALLTAMLEDAGGTLTLLGLEDEQVQALQEYHADWSMTVTPQRNQYDYLYRRADLALLQGGKLKGKRNHVNRFCAEHPDFEYRPLTTELFDDCRRLEALWREERGDNNPAYGDTIAAEQRVVENVFAHWDTLGMRGGSIFVDGRMVAFTYGAAVTTDTFDICVEKADRTVEGAFSIINQQFCAHLPEQYVYVNREEDMGLPGLRKAKLSYHPEALITYNLVEVIG